MRGRLVVALLLLWLGACAHREQAAEIRALAETGAAVTTTLATDADLAYREFLRAEERDKLNRALVSAGTADTLLSEAERRQEAKSREAIGRVLMERAAALASLARTYAELIKLSSYDATTATRDAFDATATRVEALGEAMDGIRPTGLRPYYGVAGNALGWLADSNRARQVVKANQSVTAAMLAMKKLLAAGQAPVVATLKNNVRSRATLRATLLALGLSDHGAYASHLTALADMPPAVDAAEKIRADPRLRVGVEAFVAAHGEREAALEAERFEKSIETLGALIDAHQAIDGQTAISHASIRREADALQLLIDEAKAARLQARSASDSN